MATLAENITRAFNGDWHGSYGTIPTLGHSKRDRGSTVKDSDRGGVVFNSFNGGDWRELKEECERRGLLPTREQANGNGGGWRVTGTYEYVGADGEVVYRTVRKEKDGERKRFVAQRPDGRGGWVNGLGEVERIATNPAPQQVALPWPPQPQPVARHTRSAGWSRVHRFQDSHDVAAQYGADWWLPIYRRAFPTLMSAVAVEHDGWAQRGGIDRLLTLACGRTYTVDEKIRTADWPDVLLERWSNEKQQSPGWVQKPLACDFIAYAYAQAVTCVLLPVPALQRAWRQHGRQWIGLYGQRRAENQGYTSVSVPVPRGVLMQAIVEAMFVA